MQERGRGADEGDTISRQGGSSEDEDEGFLVADGHTGAEY